MNILAIDYGSKRLGLAWTDTALGVILPYGLVEQTLLHEKTKEVAGLLKSERIHKVVVGYPVGLDGKENANTERVKKFVFELQKLTDLPIEYFDERFTSFGADNMGEGVSRDERAAMLILQGFLDSKKR